MLAILLIALGAASVGYGAAFLVYRQKPEPIPSWFREERNLPPALRRFRVILSTDSGAEAGQLFDKVVPREHSDGIVEIWDGAVCRGKKGHE